MQPGEGGPLEDWLNLEKCQPSDGLLVSLNGAFDKLRRCPRGRAFLEPSAPPGRVFSRYGPRRRYGPHAGGGYYPRILFPKLAECVDRFVGEAEALLVLRSVADKGRAGWLWRVYPEPWQLFAQGKEACVRSPRGHSVNTPRGVVATPRLPRGYSAEIRRGDAAAATWTLRGDESRRRRGRDADIRSRPTCVAGTNRGVRVATSLQRLRRDAAEGTTCGVKTRRVSVISRRLASLSFR